MKQVQSAMPLGFVISLFFCVSAIPAEERSKEDWLKCFGPQLRENKQDTEWRHESMESHIFSKKASSGSKISDLEEILKLYREGVLSQETFYWKIQGDFLQGVRDWTYYLRRVLTDSHSDEFMYPYQNPT